ncbi:PREDICTED: uncharacterized protein LOC108557720 [Nicrophorus vespilloides]|uniref:Uncharacterized protein LOC108557720 n=1 Tax=Nicrophorus vespilloides TaxID=110193 RepID=A0ABM1M5K3_NICVS|nr:PREDICTED: uncharacterized protein LOC108557720 [Nicrophorus vespilloides]
MDLVQTCKNNDGGGVAGGGEESTRTPNNRASSLTFSVGDIADVQVLLETPSHYSVTTVLTYCKKKILRPYLWLLNFVGLRPICIECQDTFSCAEFFNYVYTIHIIMFLGVGYVLQYMACFRRDRGFGYNKPNLLSSTPDYVFEQICRSSLTFSFFLPNILHLMGYVYAVTVFRSSDDDQLPSLMERVFLSLSNLSDCFVCQKKLVRTLRIFVTVSGMWIILSSVSVNYMMAESTIEFKWIDKNSQAMVLLIKILLVICTLWHDMVQAIIILNYCLQAQLLTAYLSFLRAKLIQQPLLPTEWMKDIEEFRKLLMFLNYHLAPAVCVFTLVNVSYAVSGILWILDIDNLDRESVSTIGINIMNVSLWSFIALVPFVQAAKLTNVCEIIRGIGHEVRTRPFVHQSTPGHKLDSILLYCSSLRMNATLFGVPITIRYLGFFVTLCGVIILVLGQLHYLNAK